MKFLVSLILMALLSFAVSLYLPWWSIAIVSFLIAFAIRMRPGIACLCGFLSLFLLWAGLAFYIDNNNQQIFAHKISQVILKKDDPMMLILITGLIGGIVAAFAALSGSLLRSAIR